MIRQIRRAEEIADVIEVRFDCLEPSEVRKTVQNLPESRATYLFTFRHSCHSGKREIPLGERLKFWEFIFYQHKGKFMIDIEGDPEMMMAIEPNQIRRILSLHNFEVVPIRLDSLFDMFTSQGDVAKFAFATKDIVNAISLWKLLDRAKAYNKQIIPIAMGEAGKWTRILGLAHGAFMTYASLDAGLETADGQITAKDMTDVYRVKELDKNTRVFGVIGDPVSQSLSPYMHNPAFVEAEINAVFIPLQVKDLDEFIRRMVRLETREVELNFSGFSVTMPHKQAIMKHLDAIDSTAEKIGAVNTVKIDDGKLTGYNTDADGFITPLKTKFGDLKDASVAVFGAGGAARACVYALKQEAAEVTVFARDLEKVNAFAGEFGVKLKQISERSVDSSQLIVNSFDILVDATPLGMKGPMENESLFTARHLEGVKFVYDLVTMPVDTPLISEAKKAGIPVMGGLEMLIAQGAKQFEIWTGREAPVELMRNSLISRMQQ